MATYYVLGALALLTALVVVAIKTFHNGAPTESVAQLLHEVEHPTPAVVPAVPPRV